MLAARDRFDSRWLLFATHAWVQGSFGEPGRGSGQKNPLKNVYFGEQHLHSEMCKPTRCESCGCSRAWHSEGTQHRWDARCRDGSIRL